MESLNNSFMQICIYQSQFGQLRTGSNPRGNTGGTVAHENLLREFFQKDDKIAVDLLSLFYCYLWHINFICPLSTTLKTKTFA